MNNKDRLLLNKRDAVIVAVLLLFSLCGLLLPKGQHGSYAVITFGSGSHTRISLSEDGSYTFPEAPGMVFTVSGGAIAVTESGCGDLTCVRTGSISSPGEAIVCVPGQTAVTVEGEESGNSLDVVLQ